MTEASTHAPNLVNLDLETISASGLLVPNAARSQTADEFRVIKRPLIANAMGRARPRLPTAT